MTKNVLHGQLPRTQSKQGLPRRALSGPLFLTLGIGMAPGMAQAQQLIANGTTETATGTYDTGTTAGTPGNALSALNNGTILSSTPLTLITGGNSAYAVNAQSGGTITLFNGTTVTTTGSTGIGLRAAGTSATQIATINANGAIISTSGTTAHGAQAAAFSNVTLQGGSVTTSNSGAYGLHVSTATGSLTANGVTVSTGGDNANGVNVSQGQMSLTDVTVETTATGSAAAYVVGATGSLTMTGGSLTATTGVSFGVLVTSGGTFTANGVAITKGGTAASGVSAQSGGHAILTGGSVSTVGTSSGALWATGVGSSVSADGVAVTTSAGPGLQLFSGGSVTVTNGTTVNTVNGTLVNVSLGTVGSATLVVEDSTLTASTGQGITQSGGTLDATLTNSSSSASSLFSISSNGTLNLDASGSQLSGRASTANGSTSNVTLRDGTTWTLGSGTSTVTDLTLDDATIVYTNTTSVLTATNPITLSAGGGTFNVNGLNPTLAQAMVGPGGLTKTGGGTLQLTGDSSYTGGTTIAAGTLQLGNNSATGSIAGDVVNNGSLLFSRSNALDFSGLISGSGRVVQSGSGTTTLTGANTYTGGTVVANGALFINGDQTLATGLTSVGNGTTLGGSGIIGGGVTVADGGTLSPGADAASTGALTINGNLALTEGAALDYSFGEANVVGGALNDLIEVGGGLVLDGTLNIALTPGGSFDPGIYRVINYAGPLIDNGLSLGTIPPGTSLFVQTSIDNQVNLINSTGLTFNYWDGSAGPVNNGEIDGGNGVWSSAGNDNWTDQSGAVNAPYTDAAFAVFMAAPGTVTVDDSLGPVSASGMQFASDGYLITGDPITLAGSSVLPNDTIIRVGDGTAGGAGFVATIASDLSGSTRLVKGDLGTLVLSGTNSYTGGTAIRGGVLEISDNTNLGAASGGLNLSGGTLRTTADIAMNRATLLSPAGGTFETAGATTLTQDGVVSGPGTLTKTGTGTMVLTAANSYSGGTTILGGVLQISADANLGAASSGIIIDNATLRTTAGIAMNRATALGPAGGTIETVGPAILTQAGVISGASALTKLGGGTLVLTADNSYTGGTRIFAGTLQLGDGGTSGSVAGDIADNGTLTFNRSDAFSVDGTISGFGAVFQSGSGTTTLTGGNLYFGSTLVTDGALFINGDQSLATGQTLVFGGATLGGSGTIGGDVNVATDGTLSPGAGAASVGTLTINGNLSLANGANLDYNFGQANVAGGAFNDLIDVGGSLVLDGTLNVSLTPGGSFDPGIYRVINYTGSLTDNGLTLGTVPGTDYFVQTSVANQVNLINATGLTLNFWDGAAGPKFDGAVNGGDGIWQAATGNDNWTDQSGAVNAPYTDAAFAVFMATPGTVTVDDSLGPVTTSGMQFASDGYVITGGAITLAGSSVLPNDTVIRVGDGTAGGAGLVATIASDLAGSTRLVKGDLGTLVLSGTNSYTGGTAIRGGVLEISDNTNLGAASGGLNLSGGTLRTTADIAMNRATLLSPAGGTFETAGATALTQDGIVSGPGSLTKTGTGTMILAAANSYTGGTAISDGTLQLGNGGTAGSVAGDIVDNGALVFNRSDRLDLAGVISGTGTVEQSGSGVTVLAGENTYSGGTTISAGTLQLGNGGTTGSITGDVTNNGTLAFNRSSQLDFTGLISGSGGVDQIGGGVTVLTATNTYSGATNVLAGTLRAGAENTFSATSAHTVASGATLDLDGFAQTLASLANGGTVRLAGAPGTVLTVGNYTGTGGSLLFNTTLAGDGSPSDKLLIDGGTASGSSSIVVTNAGGGGALTTANGILLIDTINGGTTAADAFTLGNPGGYAAAGPYAYTLFRSGLDGSDPEGWYLRSALDCSLDPGSAVCSGTTPPNYRPEVSLDTAIGSLALRYGSALLDTLDERMGAGRGGTPAPNLAWGRIVGLTGSKNADALGIYGSNGPGYGYNIFALQTGMDLYRSEHTGGSSDQAGFYAAYGQVNADVDHFDGTLAGKADLSAWSLGAYWTHFGKEGWYVDGVLQATRYDADTAGNLPLSTNGTGIAASIEAGYPFQLGDGFVLEPQAQLVYQSIDLDDASDGAAQVGFSNVDSLQARASLKLSRSWDITDGAAGQPRAATAWLRLGLGNEFAGEPETTFSSATGPIRFKDDTGGAFGLVNAGFDVKLDDNLSLYGSAGLQGDFAGGDNAVNGKIGIKGTF